MDSKTNITAFEHFGNIGDAAMRRRLTQELHAALSGAGRLVLTDTDTENFATALQTIINGNATLRELCSADAHLAQEITAEILEFIQKTKKTVVSETTEIAGEQELLTMSVVADFLQKSKKGRNAVWASLSERLNLIYPNNELKLDFYKKELNAAFKNQALKNAEETESEVKPVSKTTPESVWQHFITHWQKQLFERQTNQELAIIDAQRKAFCDDLYKRIEELKQLQEILSPFTKELGRLWDMSRGSWQRINFDAIKKYAELLKSDKTLAELAAMLGKMRVAEQEYEEETFSETVLRTDWIPQTAYRGDIAGVHESDDISSMLPTEAALLSDAVLETVFYKKFAEKKLQTFEFQNKTAKYTEEERENKRQKQKAADKGPFIICVDTSGSMHGTPETVAKTLCFAIMKMAIQENRKCYLISFSTQIETLDLGDLKNSLEKLVQFLQMSFHGGTDATPAIQEALRMLETNDYKKADILMISDFVMPAFDSNMQTKIALARKNTTKLHSLVIGSSHNNRPTANFDNTWIYNANTSMRGLLTLLKTIGTDKV